MMCLTPRSDTLGGRGGRGAEGGGGGGGSVLISDCRGSDVHTQGVWDSSMIIKVSSFQDVYLQCTWCSLQC